MKIKGEINRFAGDASEQRAKTFAQQHGHTQVVFSPDFKQAGVGNCFIVMDYDAPKPKDSKIVALYERETESV